MPRIDAPVMCSCQLAARCPFMVTVWGIMLFVTGMCEADAVRYSGTAAAANQPPGLSSVECAGYHVIDTVCMMD